MFDLVSIASSSRMFEFLACPSHERLRLAAGVPRQMDKFQFLNIRDALFSDPILPFQSPKHAAYIIHVVTLQVYFVFPSRSATPSCVARQGGWMEGGMDEMDDTVDDGDWMEGMMDEMYGDPLDACDRQQKLNAQRTHRRLEREVRRQKYADALNTPPSQDRTAPLFSEEALNTINLNQTTPFWISSPSMGVF
ncbi:hypothetical protein B0H14DRAFT_3465444 [Mycena olivaceomarginata]|nr:hypothetical protein B0H14DRAFT_3465444 [Mycena olivaceomarginata]